MVNSILAFLGLVLVTPFAILVVATMYILKNVYAVSTVVSSLVVALYEMLKSRMAASSIAPTVVAPTAAAAPVEVPANDPVPAL